MRRHDPIGKCCPSGRTLNLKNAGQESSRAEGTELAEIAVELARKPDGARDARQASSDLVGQKLYFERLLKNKSIQSV